MTARPTPAGTGTDLPARRRKEGVRFTAGAPGSPGTMSSDTTDPGRDGPGAPQVEVTPAEDAPGGRPERADPGEGPDPAAHQDQDEDQLPDPTAAVASGGDVQGGTPPPGAPGDGDADGPERQP